MLRKRGKSFFDKLMRPLSNSDAGSFGKVFVMILTTFLIVMFISWFVTKGTDTFVKARAGSICNRFADAIAENGKVTVAMQKELFKEFNTLKFFTGDYTVKFYVYDYSNPGAKVSIGTSTNGGTIPESTIARGKIVQVVFRSDRTMLDAVNGVFNPVSIDAGITASSSMKVD